MWYALVIAAWLTGPAGPEAAGQPHLAPLTFVMRAAFPSQALCETARLNVEGSIADGAMVDRTRGVCVPMSDPATEKAS